MSPSSIVRPVLLIVDDDAEVLRSLAFMAGTRGYDVLGCATAAQAMIRLEESISCLVLDQNLPDISGIRLLQQIRAAGIDAPALLMTTDPSAALRRQAAAVGAPIVEKPLLDESLFEQIKNLLAGG
ncbi:MAG: response regulator [Brevundimonas sp.]|uniref:response regulator n=1 Tax=Brevundimonas sp. TaxID=1871086 RepID=UPI00248A4C32|nr:response regulator [Brevundimonas sp.]MDI1326148.1 response regulator [Brevundimonas sp.]